MSDLATDSRRYQGASSGFQELQKTFFDYAFEVNTNRSIPDVRDGLKTVQRRILYTLGKGKNPYDYVPKSVAAVGMVTPIHPHSDDAVYDSIASMTVSKGLWDPAPLRGEGSFGVVSSSDKPSDARYTQVGLSKWAHDWLDDIEFAEMKPTEDETGLEPAYLPAKYPALLIPGHSGMGVGVSTRIPPFNFWDILKLTEQFVRTGDFDGQVIYPDFPTGGSMYANKREAIKMMVSGRGSYTTRATYTMDAKTNTITVTEVPYGTTVQKMKADIEAMKWGRNVDPEAKKAEDRYPAIRSVQLNQGYGQEGIKIFCTRGADLDQVEVDLFKARVFQRSETSDMTWFDGSAIRSEGVYSIIRSWYQARESILKKKFEGYLASIKTEKGRLEFFIQLVADSSHRDTYIDKVLNQSKTAATEYLVELFPNITPDQCDWIYKRAVSSFRSDSAYQERFEKLTQEATLYEGYLRDIKSVVLEELKELRASHQGNHRRRTVLTNTDIKVTKTLAAEVAEPKINNGGFAKVFYRLTKDGMLTKLSIRPQDSPELILLEAAGTEVLTGFDAAGRIFRVFGEDLAIGSTVYLPEYLGTNGEADTEILHLQRLDGSKLTLLYSDGYVAYFDTAQLHTTRKYKVIRKGMQITDSLVSVVPGKPSKVVMAYDDEKGRTFIGVADLNAKAEPKVIGNRSKVLDLRGNLAQFTVTSDAQGNFSKATEALADEINFMDYGKVTHIAESKLSKWLPLFR